ncbi:MAG: hypothetical protein V4690_02255 [Patescibacteria group bacterium]
MVINISCGGSGGGTEAPTGPSAPPSAPTTAVTMRVVDENNTPVFGAVVDVGGIKKTADAEGKVVWEVPTGTEPNMKIEANGFHGPWNTKLRSKVADYKIMRLDGVITQQFIEEAIYGDTTAPSNPGKRPALILKDNLYINIDPELLKNFPGLNMVIEETVWLNNMLEGRISATAGTKPGNEPVAFSVTIDETIGSSGQVSRKFHDDGRIAGGTMSFKNANALVIDLIRHELMHILGLNHYTGYGLMGNRADENPSLLDLKLLKYLSFLTPRTVSVRDDTLVLTLFPTATSFARGYSPKGNVELFVCNK